VGCELASSDNLVEDTGMQMKQTSSQDNEQTILTVSELNRQARITIEARFNQVWVVGEMSNFARPRSGHWYFSLKDENAQVRCAMFANRNRAVQIQPGDGQLVIARGRVSLYEGRGDFQIIVDHLEAAGEGALRQAFDQLKIKLADEGLFAPERKKTLPKLPEHVAVITSPTGAAIKDVLSVWQRRFPSLQVTVIPTAVQGEGAEAQLLAAIASAERLAPDVILLTRGGGSLEDLWSFNLESVARAVAACCVPTVSAVGHEIDVTICDFVADLRAPTPSAAAELMVPDSADLARSFTNSERQLLLLWHRYHEYLALTVANLRLQIPSPERVLERANQQVDDANLRMTRALGAKLHYEKMQLKGLARQLQNLGPGAQLKNADRQLVSLRKQMQLRMNQLLQSSSQQISSLSRMLHSVSPLPTMARGFAVVKNSEGEVLSSVTELAAGDLTTTYLHDGALTSEVKHIDKGALITDTTEMKH
jgi:exodeoxyribonuclease VII large subunit